MIVGMNGKQPLIFLVTLCLFSSLPGDKTVMAASPDLSGGHFQLQAAIVDEPTGDGTVAPVHEVFLIDTETGKVWKYQPLQWGKNKDGSGRVFAEPFFDPIQVGIRPPKQ